VVVVVATGGLRAGGPAKFFDFNLSPAKNNGKDLILPPKIKRKPASRQNQWFEIWREIRFWIFCWGMVIRNSIDFRFQIPFLRFPIPNTILYCGMLGKLEDSTPKRKLLPPRG